MKKTKLLSETKILISDLKKKKKENTRNIQEYSIFQE